MPSQSALALGCVLRFGKGLKGSGIEVDYTVGVRPANPALVTKMGLQQEVQV